MKGFIKWIPLIAWIVVWATIFILFLLIHLLASIPKLVEEWILAMLIAVEDWMEHKLGKL